jgi:hypothetical protein
LPKELRLNNKSDHTLPKKLLISNQLLSNPYTMATNSIETIYPALSTGQHFTDLEDDAWYIVTKAIADAYHSYKVRTKKSTIWEVICIGRDKYNCKFIIRVVGDTEGAQLCSFHPHTCPPQVHNN